MVSFFSMHYLRCNRIMVCRWNQHCCQWNDGFHRILGVSRRGWSNWVKLARMCARENGEKCIQVPANQGGKNKQNIALSMHKPTPTLLYIYMGFSHRSWGPDGAHANLAGCTFWCRMRLYSLYLTHINEQFWVHFCVLNTGYGKLTKNVAFCLVF